MGKVNSKNALKVFAVLLLTTYLLDHSNSFEQKNNPKIVYEEEKNFHIKKVKQVTELDIFIVNKSIPELLKKLVYGSSEYNVLNKTLSSMDTNIEESIINYDLLDDSEKIELLKSIGIGAIATDVLKYSNDYIPERINDFSSIYLINNKLYISVGNKKNGVSLYKGNPCDYIVDLDNLTYVYDISNIENFINLYNSDHADLKSLEKSVKELLAGRVEHLFRRENGDYIDTYFYMSVLDKDYKEETYEYTVLEATTLLLNAVDRIKIENGFTPNAEIKMYEGKENNNIVVYVITEANHADCIIQNEIQLCILKDVFEVTKSILSDGSFSLTEYDTQILKRIEQYADENNNKLVRTL